VWWRDFSLAADFRANNRHRQAAVLEKDCKKIVAIFAIPIKSVGISSVQQQLSTDQHTQKLPTTSHY
jgi:hypothetical protein